MELRKRKQMEVLENIKQMRGCPYRYGSVGPSHTLARLDIYKINALLGETERRSRQRELHFHPA